jgi:A/G-specific adenine glycosylase
VTDDSPRSFSDRRRARTARAALLRWYDAEKRDLPWRRTRDPYAIWISEAMLQQTRVETVIPYYERFLARFPDVDSLASADQDEVYGEWAGLGYYSRARNLQAAAREIVAQHDGQLPSDIDSLRSLPGIGRYTAGALASIAFDRCEALVDGNVARVLARLLGIREDVKSRPVLDRLWDEAALLVRGERPGDLNQALMELGATICTPRSPGCEACPWQRRCDARRAGDAESLPLKAAKKQPRKMVAAVGWIRRGNANEVLIVRRPSGGLMGGLWELPGGECQAGEKASDALQRHLRTSLGLELRHIEPSGSVTHAFTHRALRLHVFRCEARGRVRPSASDHFEAHEWVAEGALAERPHGATTRKALALLAQQPPTLEESR